MLLCMSAPASPGAESLMYPSGAHLNLRFKAENSYGIRGGRLFLFLVFLFFLFFYFLNLLIPILAGHSCWRRVLRAVSPPWFFAYRLRNGYAGPSF